MRPSLARPRRLAVLALIAAAWGGELACGSFSSALAPETDGGDGDATKTGDTGANDAAISGDGTIDGPQDGSAVAPCVAAPDRFCLDFDGLTAGPAPAPFTFGSFATSVQSDPLDRAGWEVVPLGQSAPNAGRLRVTDGGAITAQAAMERLLAPTSKKIACDVSWKTIQRAQALGGNLPTHLALVTLTYVDLAKTPIYISLVTDAGGSAALFQSNLTAGSQTQLIADLEGLDWRRAHIEFNIPLPSTTSFIIVKSGDGTVSKQIPFTLGSDFSKPRLIIGPEYVSAQPWEVLFDDIACSVSAP